MGSMTRTVWRVTATPLTRRSSTHHGTLDTTTRNASVSSRSYRLFEQAIATTTTRIQRYGCCFERGGESSYRTSGGTFTTIVCGDARRGGRRLWWWPYKEFVNMIRRAAWTALAVRRAVPANRRPPDDRFHR